jgi:EpsI family protein
MQLSERARIVLIAIALLGVGALAWSLELRPPLAVDASPMRSFPREIDGWYSEDIPLESTVEAMLRADFNLQRLYVHPVAGQIEVYVGYYGTDRGGRPEHTPWVCYPSAGWRILSHRQVWIDRERGLRANELSVEKAGSPHLVHFWYRSSRATGLLGTKDQLVDRFLGRLAGSRSDGALVRLSTPLDDGDETVARSRLSSFGSELDGLLEARWPLERPRG